MLCGMEFTWDPAKARANKEKHGVSFSAVSELDWDSALVAPDLGHTTEERFIAIGAIGVRLHVLVFAVRGDQCRIIRLRKANRREVRRYEQAKI